MVNSIVRRLESSGESEIPSKLIGELVMDALNSLDKVAYVRFASVYRNFRETRDFEEFIGKRPAPAHDPIPLDQHTARSGCRKHPPQASPRKLHGGAHVGAVAGISRLR